MTLLSLTDVEVGTWSRRVSFSVAPGEIVMLIGRNGAGKTTLLNTIAGLLRVRYGRVEWAGADVTQHDERGRVPAGIRIALEGRQLFSRLSVRRNLLLGAYLRHEDDLIRADFEWVLSVFPSLGGMLDRPAGSLSGGEQTMVNLGRALMGRPQLLLLDEPALGLAPRVAQGLIDAIRQICDERRIAAIIAEQTLAFAHAFPERVMLLVGGEIVFDGSMRDAEANLVLSSVFA